MVNVNISVYQTGMDLCLTYKNIRSRFLKKIHMDKI